MSATLSAGSLAPPFLLRTPGGDEVGIARPVGSPAVLLFFFKHDCPTCDFVAPLVGRLAQALAGAGLRSVAVSQSDSRSSLAFKEKHALEIPLALDEELSVSEAYSFDAVPCLVLISSEGRVLRTFQGFGRADFLALAAEAARSCGAKVPSLERPGERWPENRPGCASRLHDPTVAERRSVRQGAALLKARRVPVPVADDPFEFFFALGIDDGLPVVPPTEARVVRMLAGTTRSPEEVVALVPPNLAPATVEKIAINAVMAGCRPEYLRIVIAALQAACTDEFNLHGVLATTYFPTPVIVVNGPIRREVGINCAGNVFGQGFRANATIGRAVQLVVRNVGGGKPGEVDMATLGQPGKFSCCIGENEEESPWEPLHVERGFQRVQNTVTLFAGEAPRAILDQTSRSARSLATSMALCLESVAHPKFHGYGEVLLVVCPEHCRTLAADGWSKTDLRRRIQEATSRPLGQCLPDAECAEGIPIQALPPDLMGPDGRPRPEVLNLPVPKFRRNEDILIVVAGGRAGKFSAVLGGWVGGKMGSVAVTREIVD
ncbi:MAG TPA: redoxin domain-containing protein [Myxococcota bacterium]|nr:redoxin domain-containing protein [Myxococcota bacterium]